MSKPHAHKNRLLKYITKLREEVCRMNEDEHIQYPYKNLDVVEVDILKLTQEIERTELAK